MHFARIFFSVFFTFPMNGENGENGKTEIYVCLLHIRCAKHNFQGLKLFGRLHEIYRSTCVKLATLVYFVASVAPSTSFMFSERICSIFNAKEIAFWRSEFKLDSIKFELSFFCETEIRFH